MQRIVVYWSRRDFRLTDNPALLVAIAESRDTQVPLLPLFIAEDYMLQASPESQFGLPSRLFLGKAIPAFAAQFPFFLLAYGVAPRILLELASRYTITVHVNEDVYPDFYAQVRVLREKGMSVNVYADQLTVSKDTRTGSGARYSVFTPFKNAVWREFVSTKPAPRADLSDAVAMSRALKNELVSSFSRNENDSSMLAQHFSSERKLHIAAHELDLTALVSIPALDAWYWSEAEALARFDAHLAAGRLDTYDFQRDMLADEQGTSSMSLALTWGLVSSRELVARISEHYAMDPAQIPASRPRQSATAYLTELVWREFYKYLFYHDPELMDLEFQARFRGTIRWVEEPEALRRFEAWIRGETGYPLVDAAMRQIAQTGYMHNRARMVVASVLTKNLGVDWRWGQEYFRAALIDLDEASNNGGWQWGASVGADPKPIRIFNPRLQAERFDRDGVYRRRWLPAAYSADVHPLLPHIEARAEALARYGLGRNH